MKKELLTTINSRQDRALMRSAYSWEGGFRLERQENQLCTHAMSVFGKKYL